VATVQSFGSEVTRHLGGTADPVTGSAAGADIRGDGPAIRAIMPVLEPIAIC